MFFPLVLIISFVHILKDILSPGARNLFWQLFKAEHPNQFRDLKAEIKRKYPDLYHNLIESKEYNLFTPFFNHGQVTNGLKASSLAESINALLLPYKTKEPIEIFHFLETYGYSQCVNLLLLQSECTPYFQKRKDHIDKQLRNMKVCKLRHHMNFRL